MARQSRRDINSAAAGRWKRPTATNRRSCVRGATAVKPNMPEAFWTRVEIGASDECWPFLGKSGNQYGHKQAYWRGRMRSAHRVAYEITHGIQLADARYLRTDTPCVLHTCDNPPCCNPAHLRLGTQQENIQDASHKRRLAFGDANSSRRLPERLARGDANGARKHPESRIRGSGQKAAKLTETDIPMIRSRRQKGETLSAIAQTYNVSLNIIWRVCTGKSWSHC